MAAPTGRSAEVTNPSIEVLQAIARLSANADFKRLMQWMELEKAEQTEILLTQQSEPRVMHKQGYVLCLHDLMRVFGSANVALERHASAKP